MAQLSLMQAMLLGSIGVGAAGAILAWRERPEPGAVPLTALLVAQCWWSTTLFFHIATTELGPKIFWLNASWVGVPFIPVAWLYFSLEYSGYSQYLRPRYIILVLVIPVITAILAITNDFHTLLHGSIDLAVVNGELQLVRTFGPWYWLIAGYTYLLGLLGAIPLIAFIRSDVSTFRGQSLAILVGLIAPWVTNILFLLDVLPTGAVDPTPVAFSVSGIAYLGALTRFDLFGKSPTPIRPAKLSTFDRMRDGIIVLDRYRHIVDLNSRASQILEANPESLLGRPIEDVAPQLDLNSGRTDDASQMVFRPENTARAYDVTTSQVDNTHGRNVGELITLHDISDYLRQQQRLEVVNRVYRHNIRSSVQVILGSAERLQAEDERDESLKVKEKAMEITEYTDNIREILDVFEEGRERGEQIELEPMVSQLVAIIQSDYPNIEIDTSVRVSSLRVNAIMEKVLSQALDNAAQHNTNDDPKIWLTVEERSETIEITVADNGPGIDDEELVLLREGSETQLQHGSGVGMAIIVWGTELIGGEISFAENDPHGTVITISLPRNPDSQDRI